MMRRQLEGRLSRRTVSLKGGHRDAPSAGREAVATRRQLE